MLKRSRDFFRIHFPQISHNKKKKPAKLFGSLQTALIVGQGAGNVLFCHFLENLQASPLAALRAPSGDVRDAGMLRRVRAGVPAVPRSRLSPGVLAQGRGHCPSPRPAAAAPGSLRGPAASAAGPGLLGLGDGRRSQPGPGVMWPQAILLHKPHAFA